MKQKFINTKTTVVCLISVCLTISSCSYQADSSDSLSADEGLEISVTEPVERDYSDIKDSGTLRMITSYSSNSYFLHQGIEWGFEYELLNEFADEHDLALEVMIVEPDQNPYDLLNSGEGDIIANNYTITPERSQLVNFTRPYNIVNQIVVYSDAIENPPATLQELAESDITLTIRRNSSYYNTLSMLWEEGYDFNINVVPGAKDTEALLLDVANREYEATVADDNIFKASNKYMTGLKPGPTLSENDQIAWAIRKNASDLETQLNRFLYKHFRFSEGDEAPKRSTLLNILRKRYFEEGPQIAGYYNPDIDEVSGSGLISPYDDLIKTVADSAGLDWLMIASMVAQETKFNPNSESWAGAVGLMQVMPRFSEVTDRELLFDEVINLKEGVRIISEHLEHYSYLDSTNQWSLALATYNAGPGHVADARRLAIDQNKNPNEWENVADALLKLMQRKYYKDARYGFCRGIETVRYVKEIKSRYETYKTILALHEESEQPLQGLGVMGLFNFN